MRDIEEKFRKLASIRKTHTDKFHQFWLSGDSQERREAEELLDIELWQKVEKGYQDWVFLDPPDKALCEGQYVLGDVMYPPGIRRATVHGLRHSFAVYLRESGTCLADIADLLGHKGPCHHTDLREGAERTPAEASRQAWNFDEPIAIAHARAQGTD